MKNHKVPISVKEIFVNISARLESLPGFQNAGGLWITPRLFWTQCLLPSHWSTRKMAEELGISPMRVAWTWAKSGSTFCSCQELQEQFKLKIIHLVAR